MKDAVDNQPSVKNFPIVVFSDLPGLSLIDDYTSLLRHPQFRGSIPNDPSNLDSLIGEYSAPESVKCAFGHPHKKGYLVRLKDGTLALLGHNCGEKHFDVQDYTRSKNAFIVRRDRELLRRRLASLEVLNERFLAVSDNTLPLYKAAQRFYRELPDQARSQIDRMRREKDDRIVLLRFSDGRERDINRILRNQQKATELEVIGILQGVECFNHLYDVRKLVSESKGLIGSLQVEAAYSTAPERKSVRKRLDAIEVRLKRLEKAQQFLLAFLDPENLGQLSKCVDGSGNKKQIKLLIIKLALERKRNVA